MTLVTILFFVANSCQYRSGILKSGPFLQSFSSNPNQTHLSMLIRVFKIIRKITGRWVWSGLELNSAADWASRERFEEPWYRSSTFKTTGASASTIQSSIWKSAKNKSPEYTFKWLVHPKITSLCFTRPQCILGVYDSLLSDESIQSFIKK